MLLNLWNSRDDHDPEEVSNSDGLLDEALAVGDEDDPEESDARTPHVGSTHVDECNEADTLTDTRTGRRNDGCGGYHENYPCCGQRHYQLKALE